jgi:hypothetical protein
MAFIEVGLVMRNVVVALPPRQFFFLAALPGDVGSLGRSGPLNRSWVENEQRQPIATDANLGPQRKSNDQTNIQPPATT